MKKLLFLIAVAGAGFYGYHHLGWRCCNSQDELLEVQIRKEREKLPELDVEIKKLIGQVAAREVELKNLEKDIAQTEKQLDQARQAMAANNATFVKDETKPSPERQRSLRDLNRLADTVERLDAMLKARKEQREAFKEALHSAHEELVAYQNERRSLETELVQLDALVAQVRTEEIKNRIHFDKSKLAERTQRIEQLRNKAEVRQKERELHVKYLGAGNQSQPAVSEKDVLERVRKLSVK